VNRDSQPKIAEYIARSQRRAYEAAGLDLPTLRYGRSVLQLAAQSLIAPFRVKGFQSKAEVLESGVLAMTSYVANPPFTRHEYLQSYVYANNILQWCRNICEQGSEELARIADVDASVFQTSNRTVAVASLPVAEANATVELLPDTQTPIVFFNITMYYLLSAFARLFAMSCETSGRRAYNQELLASRIADGDPVFTDACDVLRGVIYGNTKLMTYRTREGRFPQESLWQTSQYRSHGFRFIAAHELSHICLGHLDSNDPDPRMVVDTRFSRFQLAELDADLLALVMNSYCIAAEANSYEEPISRETSLGRSFIHQDFVLRVFRMVEGVCNALDGREGGKSRIIGHPAYADRIFVARRLLEEGLPQDMLSDMRERTEGQHETFFRHFATIFLDAEMARGDRPHVSSLFVDAYGLSGS